MGIARCRRQQAECLRAHAVCCDACRSLNTHGRFGCAPRPSSACFLKFQSPLLAVELTFPKCRCDSAYFQMHSFMTQLMFTCPRLVWRLVRLGGSSSPASHCYCTLFVCLKGLAGCAHLYGGGVLYQGKLALLALTSPPLNSSWASRQY